MHKITAITSIVLIVCIICTCVYAKDITELQNESNELTQNLNESNNRLQAVQEQLSEHMQKLQELDNKMAEAQNELEQINIQVEDVMGQIEENETKLEQAQKEYDDLQQILDDRILTMYKAPKLQFLEVLLSSTSVTDFLSNYYGMKELMEYDKKLLEDVKTRKAEIETTKKILEEKKKQAVEAKQSQQKKTQVITNTKTMREYYISQLSEQERELQTKIDEYNTQVAEIEAEIKLLALNSISEDYIGGALTWPVPGYTSLTSLYGMRVHPITGAYKLHTGIDISAPLNTSFVAAANGIVSKATFNTAYGNMVIIDHGGGVQTLYAHGNEILVQVGQTVSAGTEVLKVGSTGYSTGPHAHFEIRINGQTVNPLDYLLTNSTEIEDNAENNGEESNTEDNSQETNMSTN